MTEQRKFHFDISELLNLIIHSFYSNKDVFLRELLSNASDAIDKQRHLDLTREILDKDYCIKVDPITLQKENQLIIEDNGIGMSVDDLVNNLSTIAKSGTKEFVKQLSDKSDMIGQFGVGFYSGFLVSEMIHIYTRKEDGDLLHWYSNADQYYTIETIEEDNESLYPHGTRIILDLKDDSVEYLQETNLRRIISQYSSFLLYPIELYIEKEVEVESKAEVSDEKAEVTEEKAEVSDEKAEVSEADKIDAILDEELNKLEKNDVEPTNDAKVETSDEVVIEDGGESSGDEETTEEKKETTSESKTVPIKEKKKVREYELINGNYPIWYKKTTEVETNEYEELYKTISKEWDRPLFWKHFHTEGAYEFKGILYIPKSQSIDMLGERNKDKRAIKLYVKKVLVLNELDKEMMPDWMNFVVGVIDSADLPLNVSREMLQQTKVLQALKNQLKKQVLSMLNELIYNEDKYSEFYNSFHKNIKLGIHEGDESLMSFLKIKNSKDDKLINFEKYIESYRKDESQDVIYYSTGTQPQSSLFGNLYIENGYTVLYFDEPIDEFMLQRSHKFKEMELVNINKDHKLPWVTDVSTDTVEKYKTFCEWIQTTINDSNVDEVKISNKLVRETDEAACLLSSKWGWSGNMEKLMLAQPLGGDTKISSIIKGRRALEINVNHPLILSLYGQFETQPESLTNKVKLLYQCCMLSGGYPLSDTQCFVKNVMDVLQV